MRTKKSVVQDVLDEVKSSPVMRTDDVMNTPLPVSLPPPDRVVSFLSTLIIWIILAVVVFWLLLGVWWVFFGIANSFTHFTIISGIGVLLVVLGGVYVALRHFGVLKEWKKLS